MMFETGGGETPVEMHLPGQHDQKEHGGERSTRGLDSLSKQLFSAGEVALHSGSEYRGDLSEIFDRVQLTDREIFDLFGATTGSRVALHKMGRGVVNVRVQDRKIGLEIDAIVQKGLYGSPEVELDWLSLDEDSRGKGVGTRVFTRMAKNLSAMRARRIDMFAASGQSFNGYYTWVRLGADGSATSKAKRQFPGVTTLQDVMSREGGSEWWKANGEAVDVVFDLRPRSRSMGILSQYTRVKGIRAT